MGEKITLTCKDGQKIGAYLARPAGPAKGAIVVLQEIFGANQHIRKTADLYAAEGYLAIAPALFDRVEPGLELGYTGDDPKKGIETRGKTELPKTLLDIEASVEAVKAAGKVGVVGYCWGGTLAYATAVNLPGVAAAVGYYGGGIAAMSDKKPQIPIMLHFGEKDHSISMADVEKVKANQPQIPVFVYPAGHGFNCDERASFDKENADLARSRTLAFFAKQLA
jgi:carboxymethylenebutenolidase